MSEEEHYVFAKEIQAPFHVTSPTIYGTRSYISCIGQFFEKKSNARLSGISRDDII